MLDRAHPAVPARSAGRHDAQQRTAWLDAARGLAIALVVLLHASEWLDTAGIDSAGWVTFHILATGVRLPLFFVVSGLLAQRWLAAGWRRLVQGRLLLLAWVYLVWQLVGSGTALAGAQITGDQMSAGRMLVSLAATVVRPRFELWFLWALVIFLVVARATRGVPLRIQFSGAAIVSAVALSDLVPQVNLGWNGVPGCYLFFLIGMYHRPAILAFAERLTPARSVLVIAAWAALAGAARLLEAEGVAGVGLLIRLAGMAAGVAVAVNLAGWQPLRALGSRTLPVYLAHTPIIVLIAWALTTLPDHGAGLPAAWLLPLPLTAVAIGGSLALHRLVVQAGIRGIYEPPPSVVAAAAGTAPGRHASRR